MKIRHHLGGIASLIFFVNLGIGCSAIAAEYKDADGRIVNPAVLVAPTGVGNTVAPVTLVLNTTNTTQQSASAFGFLL